MQNSKTGRLEARVTPDQRGTLEQAASLAGTSLSAFVVGAALDRAEELISAQMTTLVPAEYFDRVIRNLDEADAAPALARAARRTARRPRISA